MKKLHLIGLSAAFVVAGAAAANAGPLRPDEARRFVADKMFSYSCFDGTRGVGRIHADGSVMGTIQLPGRESRFITMPSGTIRVSSTSICASLRGSMIQPCFDVVQTSSVSFRGSVSGLGFAYCDFVRYNPRRSVSSARRTFDVSTDQSRATVQPVSLKGSVRPAPIQSATVVNPR